MNTISLTAIIVIGFFVFFIIISIFSKKTDYMIDDVNEDELPDNVRIIEKEVIVDKTDYSAVDKMIKERDEFVNIAEYKNNEINNLKSKIKEKNNKLKDYEDKIDTLNNTINILKKNKNLPDILIEKINSIKHEKGFFYVIVHKENKQIDIIRKFPLDKYETVKNKLLGTKSHLGRYYGVIVLENDYEVHMLHRSPW